MVRVASGLLLLCSVAGCRFDRSGMPPSASRDAPPAPDLIAPDLIVPADTTQEALAPDADPCTSCVAPTPICCDKGQGTGCHADPSGCLCGEDLDPCGGVYPVCCDDGETKRCEASPSGCSCDEASGEPCSAGFATCCDKGMGARCHVDSTGCKS